MWRHIVQLLICCRPLSKCTRLEVKWPTFLRKVSKVLLKILLSLKFIFSTLPVFLLHFSYIAISLIAILTCLWIVYLAYCGNCCSSCFQLLFPQCCHLITGLHLYWVLDRYSLYVTAFLLFLFVAYIVIISFILVI